MVSLFILKKYMTVSVKLPRHFIFWIVLSFVHQSSFLAVAEESNGSVSSIVKDGSDIKVNVICNCCNSNKKPVVKKNKPKAKRWVEEKVINLPVRRNKKTVRKVRKVKKDIKTIHEDHYHSFYECGQGRVDNCIDPSKIKIDKDTGKIIVDHNKFKVVTNTEENESEMKQEDIRSIIKAQADQIN